MFSQKHQPPGKTLSEAVSWQRWRRPGCRVPLRRPPSGTPAECRAQSKARSACVSSLNPHRSRTGSTPCTVQFYRQENYGPDRLWCFPRRIHSNNLKSVFTKRQERLCSESNDNISAVAKLLSGRIPEGHFWVPCLEPAPHFSGETKVRAC